MITHMTPGVPVSRVGWNPGSKLDPPRCRKSEIWQILLGTAQSSVVGYRVWGRPEIVVATMTRNSVTWRAPIGVCTT